MANILWSKFMQHGDLNDLLLSTGDATLVEWATEDNEINRFWSKVDGEGKNVLGQLLVDLRLKLRAAPGSISQ